jgi:hypothetical protein
MLSSMIVIASTSFAEPDKLRTSDYALLHNLSQIAVIKPLSDGL